MIDDYDKKHDEARLTQVDTSTNVLDDLSNDHDYYKALEQGAQKLQNRLGKMLQLLQFDDETSSPALLDAIKAYQNKQGKVNSTSPAAFLTKVQKQQVKQENGFNAVLYKVLLYFSVADGIKSGAVNLRHSYHYRSIQDYLMPEDDWNNNKTKRLKQAEIDKYRDPNKVLASLQLELDKLYALVNQNLTNKTNPYLVVKENGKITVSTPKTSEVQEQFIGELMENVSYVPLQQILADVNHAVDFTDTLQHFSIKHVKSQPAFRKNFFCRLDRTRL